MNLGGGKRRLVGGRVGCPGEPEEVEETRLSTDHKDWPVRAETAKSEERGRRRKMRSSIVNIDTYLTELTGHRHLYKFPLPSAATFPIKSSDVSIPAHEAFPHYFSSISGGGNQNLPSIILPLFRFFRPESRKLSIVLMRSVRS